MIFKVKTKRGKTYTDTIEYAVIRNKDGERAILQGHIPIILHINEGYIRFEGKDATSFLAVEQALVEFKEDCLTILALEAQMAMTYEQAKEALKKEIKELEQLSKKQNVDYTKYERELKENIRKGKAGHL